VRGRTAVDKVAAEDEGYGIARGSFAELRRRAGKHAGQQPAALSFEQAAAGASSGITVFRACATAGRIKPGRRSWS